MSKKKHRAPADNSASKAIPLKTMEILPDTPVEIPDESPVETMAEPTVEPPVEPSVEPPVESLVSTEEPVQEESVQDEPVQEKPVQEESVQEESEKEEPNTAEPHTAEPASEEMPPITPEKEIAFATAESATAESVPTEAFVLVHAEAEPAPEPDEVLPPESRTDYDTDPHAPAEKQPHGIECEIAHSFSGKMFNALALLGPLAGLVFLLAQTAPGLLERAISLAGADLAMHDAFMAFKQGVDPLLFVATPYGPLPPAYFWFLAGLESAWQLTGLPLNMPLLILAGTAASAGLLLILGWISARTLGCDRRCALAANMVLLSAFAFAGSIQIATPDLLFAACISASALCLYTGWLKDRAPFTLLLGFLLAGLAVLINGELGLILPLGASLLFLFWRGAFRRAGARDGAFAFLILLAALGGWLAWLGLTHGREPLEAFATSIFGRWGDGFSPTSLPLDILDLSLTLLPWTLLVLFLPYERIYRIPVHLWRNRKANPGVGFAWCVVLVGLLALVGGVEPFTLLIAIAPFAALLAGRAVLDLSAARSRMFFGLLGIGLFALAIVLGASSLLPMVQTWLPADMAAMLEGLSAITMFPGVIFMAAAALLFAFILLKLTDKRYPAGALLVLLLSVTAMVLPLNLLTLPYLSAVPVSTPVESAPVESAPAESAPVESAPAESAPVESAPVESAPDSALTPLQ